jgi:two-component system chemotaxis response regulator CheB
MMAKVRVLIVDDSALIRSLLSKILQSDPDISVVGAAADAYEARELIKALNPDVLTLDIEMPKMDGVAFLRNIMRLRPMPVVMISTLTELGAPVTLEALDIGAVDFFPKPKSASGENLSDYALEIIEKVKNAAAARVKPLESLTPSSRVAKGVLTLASARPGVVVAIGASTGGTEAIKEVLIRLPPNSPPIVMAQHIPQAFSGSYAKRLDGCCQVRVFEATEGQPIEAGCAYLAPGDSHLVLQSAGRGFVCRLLSTERVNRHRPSVDVLFASVADNVGKRAIAALLTGMGADGARGLLQIRNAGGHTVIQDEESSVVWGMPGAAFRLGAAAKVLPLEQIPQEIVRSAGRSSKVDSPA